MAKPKSMAPPEPASPDAEVGLSIRMPPPLRDAFNREAKRRDLSGTRAGRQAIREWLAKTPSGKELLNAIPAD